MVKKLGCMNLQVMEFDNNSDKLNEERSRAILFFFVAVFSMIREF